jgi:small multidrug resistance pump
MGWFYLFLAIIMEVFGTTSMKYSEGFTKIVPSIIMFVFYGLSLSALTLALKNIEIGVAYAIWSGLGTALITMIGIFLFKESVTALKIISIVIIIIGVIGLNLSGGIHEIGEKEERSKVDKVADRLL